MRAAFWIALVGLCLPLYSYLVYPILLFILAAFVQIGRDGYYLVCKRDRRKRSRRTPSVSVIIAAFNEEEVIERTLTRCLALNYPPDRIEVIVGSDGSQDRTVEIARTYEDRGVCILDFPQRRGKLSVLSDCVGEARGDILIFTDANTLLEPDSVANLVRHFDSPRVGAVCGELRLSSSGARPGDEGLYWRYEVILKTLESRIDAVLGANGAIYALRKELFPTLKKNVITDDFVIPMKVRASGFRVLYDPEAVAVEEVPCSVSGEFKRRLRIGAGNWQALRECAELLLPHKGFVSFAFWSHKVLRWFAPFLLAAGFLANLFLLSARTWQVILAVQIAFYGAAGVGLALRRLDMRSGPLRPVSYFVAINAALAIGLVRGLVGAQGAAWHRTSRQPVPAGRK